MQTWQRKTLKNLPLVVPMLLLLSCVCAPRRSPRNRLRSLSCVSSDHSLTQMYNFRLVLWIPFYSLQINAFQHKDAIRDI